MISFYLIFFLLIPSVQIDIFNLNLIYNLVQFKSKHNSILSTILTSLIDGSSSKVKILLMGTGNSVSR